MNLSGKAAIAVPPRARYTSSSVVISIGASRFGR